MSLHRLRPHPTPPSSKSIKVSHSNAHASRPPLYETCGTLLAARVHPRPHTMAPPTMYGTSSTLTRRSRARRWPATSPHTPQTHVPECTLAQPYRHRTRHCTPALPDYSPIATDHPTVPLIVTGARWSARHRDQSTSSHHGVPPEQLPPMDGWMQIATAWTRVRSCRARSTHSAVLLFDL